MFDELEVKAIANDCTTFATLQNVIQLLRQISCELSSESLAAADVLFQEEMRIKQRIKARIESESQRKAGRA